MAGKVMDMQVGFAIVNVVDPTSGQQIPLIGSFLIISGDHPVGDQRASYDYCSVGGEFFGLFRSPGWSLICRLRCLLANFTGGIFVTGMKIAMPITFAILLTNVGLGILSRTMPQMNIFVVGIPMQLMIGIVVLSMIIPFYVLFLDVLFNEMYGNISLAVRALQ